MSLQIPGSLSGARFKPSYRRMYISALQCTGVCSFSWMCIQSPLPFMSWSQWLSIEDMWLFAGNIYHKECQWNSWGSRRWSWYLFESVFIVTCHIFYIPELIRRVSILPPFPHNFSGPSANNTPTPSYSTAIFPHQVTFTPPPPIPAAILEWALSRV